MALHGAWKDILSGIHDVTLAFGLDKFYHEDKDKIMLAFEHGIDREEKPRLEKEYRAVCHGVRTQIRTAARAHHLYGHLRYAGLLAYVENTALPSGRSPLGRPRITIMGPLNPKAPVPVRSAGGKGTRGLRGQLPPHPFPCVLPSVTVRRPPFSVRTSFINPCPKSVQERAVKGQGQRSLFRQASSPSPSPV